MITYIALLRGINVSGQKIIKMTELKTMFESMQFGHVRTYIQSGNVIFETDETDTGKLVRAIEAEITRTFGFDVVVVMRTADELEAVIERNPFAAAIDSEDGRVYVSFLSAEPTSAAIDHLLTYTCEADEYRAIGREVYILSRKGYGKSLFSNNFLEKKLGVSATTRNWESVNKLADMGRG